MINRYRGRRVVVNNISTYKNYLNNRGVTSIRQYNTPRFRYFTQEELNKIRFFEHIWTTGDRLYKLAYRYLGDHSDWWLLLRFNQLKNETDIKVGDVIKIPSNPEQLTTLLES